jgi:kumamolisin
MPERQPHYAPFAPSHKPAPPGQPVGPVDAQTPIEISIYLKPRQALRNQPTTRADLAASRAESHADDIQRIRAFAAANGLTVTAVEPGRRLVKLSGTAAQMQTAFRTTLAMHENQGVRFRARAGTLQLPQDMHDSVEAILGLDTRPQAQPHFQMADPAAAAASFLPNQVAQLYGFPTTGNGAGQTIALIELGGGYLDSDTATAFAAMGLPPPTVTAIAVDGGQNTPTPDDGADAEVALDIQVAGGAAPGAAIAVYFAPNTDQGFADAISQAVHDNATAPSVISISWGSAEPNWTSQAVTAMNTALQDAGTLNVSVFVAAGDNLSTDSVADGAVHVDFPASSPYAIGCGGTRLDASTTAITDEIVWNDGTSGTGGGISALFPVPAFQQSVTLPANPSTGAAGRGVPDVAGDAAPATGYSIVVNGQTGTVGGTSAVAPLWAGLTALINQANGAPAGFFLPALYANAATALREITTGTNIPSGSTLGYTAGPGWNACTGLGVPIGTAVQTAIAPTPAPPTS